VTFKPVASFVAVNHQQSHNSIALQKVQNLICSLSIRSLFFGKVLGLATDTPDILGEMLIRKVPVKGFHNQLSSLKEGIMKYQQVKFCKLLSELDSEEKARAWIWLAKFDSKEFIC